MWIYHYKATLYILIVSAAVQDGVPTDAPQNITWRFLNDDIVKIVYDAPSEHARNEQITKYEIQIWLAVDHEHKKLHETSEQKVVFGAGFGDLVLNGRTDYEFRIQANTMKRFGPRSPQQSFRTVLNIARAPPNVKSMATTDSVIQVLWDGPLRSFITGYEVFYSLTELHQDFEQWQRKIVGQTLSMDLIDLERNGQYNVAVAVRTKWKTRDNVTVLGRLSPRVTVKVKPEYVPLNLRDEGVISHTIRLTWEPPIRFTPVDYMITYDAYKEFVDAQAVTQTIKIFLRFLVSNNTMECTIRDLFPFTTYHVNVTAIPDDRSYRPTAKITATTPMAAPQPMVKPDFSVTNDLPNIKKIEFMNQYFSMFLK